VEENRVTLPSGEEVELAPLEYEGMDRDDPWIRNLMLKIENEIADADTMIQIRPERSSYMQWTIDVYDACRWLDRDAVIVVEPRP
jgi:hypothetical protein